MEKTIAIGDIHGSNIWEQIVKKEKDANKIIFVGDYFDSYNLSAPIQLENFQKILDFQKENKDRVEIILGNHDFNYLVKGKDGTSGYNAEYSSEINSILTTNIKNLKIVKKIDNIIFSHAGFSKSWIKRLNHFKLDLENHFEQEINDLFFSTYDKYNPVFDFYRHDYSKIGENINQGPLRIRPDSLSSCLLENYIQVVGHSYVDRSDRGRYKNKGLYFIDNLVSHFGDENNERKYYLKIIKENDKYTFKEKLI